MTSDRYPSTWLVYLIAAAAVVAIALDVAGIALNMASLLAILGLGVTALITLVRTPSLLRKHRARGLLPLAVLLLAAPAGLALAASYTRLHFPLRRAHYEQVAVALQAGTYSLPLKPEDAVLGRAHVVRDGSQVIAVSFTTVSHGFAGHGGYLRAFGDEAALKRGHPPGGWKFARPLGGSWYAVGEN